MMGTGRWRAGTCCVLSTLAFGLIAAGCGTEDHPNDPRPALPIEVTAAISDGRLSVEPNTIGFRTGGSEQPLDANEGQKNPELSSDLPVTVSFTVANTTETDTAIQISGAVDHRSPPILASGTGDFKLELPTGEYTVSAVGVPQAETTFKVGPVRISTQNDLLLP